MLRFRPLPGLTLAFLAALGILVSLGTWQLQRLSWKETLLARVEARAHAPARPLAEVLAGARGPGEGLDGAAAEYAHVRVSGRFLPATAYLFTLAPELGPGHMVLSPLQPAEGPPILVERGFVPGSVAEARAWAAVPAGEVTLTGLLRLSERPGLFTPPPAREGPVFYVRDVPAMAEALGLEAVLPLTLAADRDGGEGGLLIGGMTRLDFPNRHLEYALTWFGFALLACVFYLAYHRAQGRLGRTGRPPGPSA
ncbi:MAG: SURF1 family protein [Alphaproteobacteria bacterium]|nr:SURF1 family protein [Alphaproteobacteria bacterium]